MWHPLASLASSGTLWACPFWKAVNAEKGRIKPESNLPTAQPAAKGMLTGLYIWALRCSASGSIQLENSFLSVSGNAARKSC